MIQNADDAGANVVRVLLDENAYATESLLSPSMARLQGPAVLVFNDAIFAETDFRSLARIGQATKLEKLATTGAYSLIVLSCFNSLYCVTGRFGLGFNAVYHLTDVPSFVSGGSLVFFDPHTSYVPGATPAQPGLRIRLQTDLESSLASEFPNQCQPYNFFGCNFNGPFPGTLFRFPLRTEAMAKLSEVSKTAYTVETVKLLLDQLKVQLPILLLFLRNVCTLEVVFDD